MCATGVDDDETPGLRLHVWPRQVECIISEYVVPYADLRSGVPSANGRTLEGERGAIFVRKAGQNQLLGPSPLEHRFYF